MKGMIADARAFSDAMNKVSKVLKKSPIPILEEIRVTVKNGICTLTGTDLETWLTASIPVQGDDMDFVLFKTKDVIKACAHFDGPLTVEVSEQPEKKGARKLRLYCGQRLAEYDATSAADCPSVVSVEEGRSFRANAAQLLERIERVRYATIKPGLHTRPLNTCVQFNGQRIFSLDGFRLACDAREDVTFPMPFLCHGSALSYMKVFGKNDIAAQIDESWVLFTDGETSLYVRRHGVDTFDVEAAVPKQYQETVTVRTADFIKELNYLKECAPGAAKPYVRFAGELLTLAVPGGRFCTSISVAGRGSLSIGFDLRYMLDALKQFKDEPEVTVKLSGVFSPIVIEAKGRGDFALVLPVHLKEEMAA